MRCVFAIVPLLIAGCALPRYPAPEAQQARLRDRGDIAAMRAHGWAVLAEAVRPGPDGRPRFAGWQTLAETFGEGRTAGLGFRRIDQLETGLPVRQGAGAPMLMRVQFNRPAYRHIRAQALFRRVTLAAINARFAPDTPTE